MCTFCIASTAGAVASCAGLEVAWDSLEGCLGALTGVMLQGLADLINLFSTIL